MKESAIERFFRMECKKQGWLCLKWVSPSMAGLPDRMILTNGGRVFFAELKAPGKRPRRLQTVVHTMLRRMGFQVYVIDSRETAAEVVRKEVQYEI